MPEEAQEKEQEDAEEGPGKILATVEKTLAWTLTLVASIVLTSLTFLFFPRRLTRPDNDSTLLTSSKYTPPLTFLVIGIASQVCVYGVLVIANKPFINDVAAHGWPKHLMNTGILPLDSLIDWVYFRWTYPDSVDGLWLVDDVVGG